MNCRLLISDCRLIGHRKIAAVAVAVLTLSACGQSERPVLEQFFGASRLRDTTALQAVSTVIFEPREQGIVRIFEITEVTPERTLRAAVAKDVTVQAPVILPDGQTVRKTIVITLQREGGDRTNRWRVVAFTDAEPSPPAPPS